MSEKIVLKFKEIGFDQHVLYTPLGVLMALRDETGSHQFVMRPAESTFTDGHHGPCWTGAFYAQQHALEKFIALCEAYGGAAKDLLGKLDKEGCDE